MVNLFIPWFGNIDGYCPILYHPINDCQAKGLLLISRTTKFEYIFLNEYTLLKNKQKLGAIDGGLEADINAPCGRC
jgi:hypothetical protein